MKTTERETEKQAEKQMQKQAEKQIEVTKPKIVQINPKIKDYLNKHRDQSPLLVLDGERVRRDYQRLQKAYPDIGIYYAMKANPHPDILRVLKSCGAYIDAASLPEIELALKTGFPADRISYGNIAKKSSDIRAAYKFGVRMFVFDCQEELEKLAKHAPGADIFYRLRVLAEDALLPLSEKFGNGVATGEKLLLKARDMGVNPVGVAFHVGSQQLHAKAWVVALEEVKKIYDHCREQGLQLTLINVGGGLPTPMVSEPTIDIEKMMQIVKEKIDSFCDMTNTRVIAEPGRYLCAESGILQSQVVLNSISEDGPNTQWVFLDCGRFHGLWEAADSQMLLPVYSADREGPVIRTILTGPTCDGADTMYRNTEYLLPRSLQEGDRLWFLDAGAYSYSMGTAFNGIRTADTICLS